MNAPVCLTGSRSFGNYKTEKINRNAVPRPEKPKLNGIHSHRIETVLNRRLEVSKEVDPRPSITYYRCLPKTAK